MILSHIPVLLFCCCFPLGSVHLNYYYYYHHQNYHYRHYYDILRLLLLLLLHLHLLLLLLLLLGELILLKRPQSFAGGGGLLNFQHHPQIGAAKSEGDRRLQQFLHGCSLPKLYSIEIPILQEKRPVHPTETRGFGDQEATKRPSALWGK